MKRAVLVLTAFFCIALLAVSLNNDSGVYASGITVVPPQTLTIVPITPTATVVYSYTVVLPSPTPVLTPIPGATPTIGITIPKVGLEFQPYSGMFTVGQTFNKTIALRQVSAEETWVKRAEIYVNFDPKYVKVEDIVPSDEISNTVYSIAYDTVNNGTIDLVVEFQNPIKIGTLPLFKITFLAAASTASLPFGSTALSFNFTEPRRTRLFGPSGEPMSFLSMAAVLEIKEGPTLVSIRTFTARPGSFLERVLNFLGIR